MKVYYAVLKLRLLHGLQYRAAAFAGVATQFFWGFLYIMIFLAFYSQAQHEPPMSLGQLVAYIWLQQAFLALIVLWYRDNELFELITSGNVAYELCRPCGLYEFWYAKLLAQRLSGALLRCFPILGVAFILPEPYRMPLPSHGTSFFLFAAALILGLILLVAISMLLYISVFVTLSPTGSLLMFGLLGDFFAGSVIPIPLMPIWLQQIAYLLPFRWTADFPFRVYSGHIEPNEALIGLLIQVGWLLLIVWMGKKALQRTMRKVVIQGG